MLGSLACSLKSRGTRGHRARAQQFESEHGLFLSLPPPPVPLPPPPPPPSLARPGFRPRPGVLSATTLGSHFPPRNTSAQQTQFSASPLRIFSFTRNFQTSGVFSCATNFCSPRMQDFTWQHETNFTLKEENENGRRTFCYQVHPQSSIHLSCSFVGPPRTKFSVWICSFVARGATTCSSSSHQRRGPPGDTDECVCLVPDCLEGPLHDVNPSLSVLPLFTAETATVHTGCVTHCIFARKLTQESACACLASIQRSMGPASSEYPSVCLLPQRRYAQERLHDTRGVKQRHSKRNSLQNQTHLHLTQVSLRAQVPVSDISDENRTKINPLWNPNREVVSVPRLQSGSLCSTARKMGRIQGLIHGGRDTLKLILLCKILSIWQIWVRAPPLQSTSRQKHRLTPEAATVPDPSHKS